MQDRKYDIIIWGATGFTGRLVAEYLWEKYGNTEFKWAIAGRSEEKLSQVSEELGLKNIPILLADSFDLTSLKNLARQTKVICTTVGPYSKYGDSLVQACVEEGCHYCDLTGEVPWMRKMIDQHHLAAEEKKLKIVHTCGFDSIPSDLGAMKLQNEFYKKFGYYAEKISTRIAGIKGELSGGTYSSMTSLMETARKDSSIRSIISNMYALNPDPHFKGADKSDLKSVKKDNLTGHWICPFIMAGINTKVVRRSNALENFKYGYDFSYEEAMMCGRGIKGRLKGITILMGLGLLMAAKEGGLLKKIIDGRMPKPGEGPDKESRESGFFKFILFAEGKNSDSLNLIIKGKRDPGYGATSRMLGEAAISLLSDDLPEIYGILTPAVAMGEVLEKRLEGNVDFYINNEGEKMNH